MYALLAHLERLGGVASLAELMAGGHDMGLIWLLADSRKRLMRVRKGIYALRDTPELALRACRAGGQLDCISALTFHGEREPNPGDRLHIRVPSTGAPRRGSARRTGVGPEVIIHWSRRPFSGTRASVTVDEAYRQVARCRALTPPRARDSL